MAKKKDTGLENFAGFDFGTDGNPTEFIPTGYAELDYKIASGLLHSKDETPKAGGLPTGTLAMFYGGEGAGKSSLAYRICGSAQRMGKVPIWVDVENSFSESLALINGVDLKKIGRKKMFDPANPENVFGGEYALDAVIEACKKGAGVVVLDSVGALVPQFVMEKNAEQETMASLARLLGRTVNKICAFAAANNTLVIFINQLRVNPGAGMYKDPEGYPGGKAIAHACSVILKMNKVNAKDAYTYIESEEGEPKMIAGAANTFIQKNRFAAPHFGGIRIPVYYETYFPEVQDTAFEVGRQTKTIKVREGVYSFGGLKIKGKKEFIAEIVAKNKVSELIAQIKKDASENKDVVLPVEILNYEKHVAYSEENKEKLEKAKKTVAKSKQKDKEEEVEAVISEEKAEVSDAVTAVVTDDDI